MVAIVKVLEMRNVRVVSVIGCCLVVSWTHYIALLYTIYRIIQPIY